MPDISKIKINDATYDIKDKTARESINSLSTDTQNISEGVNDIKSRIGSSSDTSVGTSGGIPQTLFAGIKGILEWFTSYWTSARAAKIDNLDAKISTCAKASDWTSTRAGLIDTINTNAAAAKTDAAEAKNNTATNNTGSKTGILSQKLSYIIVNLLESTSYGLNAIKTAINTVDGIVDSIKTYTATNNSASKTGVLSQKLSYIIAGLLENSTYGLNAIKTAINTISTNTSNGSIRKIIRGTFSFTATSQAISISLTNYNKAVVILNGNTIGTSGNIQDIYVGGLTNTTLTLKTMTSIGEDRASYGSYQIIEYY